MGSLFLYQKSSQCYPNTCYLSSPFRSRNIILVTLCNYDHRSSSLIRLCNSWDNWKRLFRSLWRLYLYHKRKLLFTYCEQFCNSDTMIEILTPDLIVELYSNQCNYIQYYNDFQVVKEKPITYKPYKNKHLGNKKKEYNC